MREKERRAMFDAAANAEARFERETLEEQQKVLRKETARKNAEARAALLSPAVQPGEGAGDPIVNSGDAADGGQAAAGIAGSGDLPSTECLIQEFGPCNNATSSKTDG